MYFHEKGNSLIFKGRLFPSIKGTESKCYIDINSMRKPNPVVSLFYRYPVGQGNAIKRNVMRLLKRKALFMFFAEVGLLMLLLSAHHSLQRFSMLSLSICSTEDENASLRSEKIENIKR